MLARFAVVLSLLSAADALRYGAARHVPLVVSGRAKRPEMALVRQAICAVRPPQCCFAHHLQAAASQVNTAEFEEEIQDCSTPIILDVFAVWCGPCQLMAPELEQV